MRWRILLKLGIVVGVLSAAVLLGGCETEQQQALRLLERAQEAERTVTLEGTVQTEIVRGGRTVQATAEVKRWPDRSVTRFTEGPAAGREVVRQGGRFWRAGPGPEAPEAGSPALEGLPPPEQVGRRYEIALGERTTIAGQPAVQLIIRPRRGHGQAQLSLWVDPRNGFALARERRDGAGRVVAATRYVEVKYGEPSTAPPPPRPAGGLPPGPGRPPGPVAPPGPPPAGLAPVPGAPARPPVPPSTEEGPPPVRPQPDTGQHARPAPPGERLRPEAPRGELPRRPPQRWREQPREERPETPGRPRPDEPQSGAPRGGQWQRPPGAGHPPVEGGGRLMRVEELAQTLGLKVAVPAWLPDGFRLRGAMLTRETPFGHGGSLRFSDGVHHLAVIVARRPAEEQRKLPPESEGHGNAVVVRQPRGPVALAGRGDTVYVVMGPLSEDMLQRIAASIP